MTLSLRRSVSVGLVLCLVLLTGPVYAQTVRHAAHHAHHNAATHATALCSLMCVAGQVMEASALDPPGGVGLVTTLVWPCLPHPAGTAAPATSSRGPPHV